MIISLVIDATAEEMERFHSHEYVDFLKRVSPDTEQEFEKVMPKFNVGPMSGMLFGLNPPYVVGVLVDLLTDASFICFFEIRLSRF